MRITRRSMLLIAATMIVGCSQQDDATIEESAKPQADFSSIQREAQLYLDICGSNSYLLDDEMIEYSLVVGDGLTLDEKTATQSEVDEMAERMRESRRAVVEYHEPEDTIQTDEMSYIELCQSLEKGRRYHLEGFITFIQGNMNSDRHVTIRWHGSDSKDECCQIVIPHEFYKTDVYPQDARNFRGSGVFEGYKNSDPLFTCRSRFDFIE